MLFRSKMKRKNLRSVGKTTNNTDIEMLPMFPLDKPIRLQVKETVFNTYDYKLFGEITEVDDYFDLIDALNYASLMMSLLFVFIQEEVC